jgi:hypothetical protein
VDTVINRTTLNTELMKVDRLILVIIVPFDYKF